MAILLPPLLLPAAAAALAQPMPGGGAGGEMGHPEDAAGPAMPDQEPASRRSSSAVAMDDAGVSANVARVPPQIAARRSKCCRSYR